MAEQRISTGQTIPTEDHAYEEKKIPTAYTTPITPGEEDLENGGTSDALAHWQPGFFAQFPWLGIGALCGVLLCLVASILVLVLSNGKTQTETWDHKAWPKAVAPNVLVSIFNSVANICFGIAISESITTSSAACSAFLEADKKR